MCPECKALKEEVDDLEQYAADLIKDIRCLEDAVLDLLHLGDRRRLSRLLDDGAGRRFISYVPLGSPLEEQLVQGLDETRRQLAA